MTTWHSEEVTISDFAAQDVTPFQQSLDELEEFIDRSERNGFSGEDAAAARSEFEDLSLKFNCLVLRKVKLRNWLAAAEKASE